MVEINMNYLNYYKNIFILCAVISLSGCSGTFLSYKGKVITQENNIIDLKQGDQQGIWKTNELSIIYHYQLVNGSVKISGEVDLLGGLQTGFNAVDHLIVQLLILNDNSTVINNVNIYSADHFHSTKYIPMLFDATISIPSDAKSISFTYDGRLSDGAGVDEGTSYDFWYFPK
jgi:hypothetical protein